MLMINTQTIINSLEELPAVGIKISIDDFGTGFSSLSYLPNLPVDTLKIDRSFVSCIEKEKYSLGIIQTIITLAHTLGLDVITEGVETVSEMKIL
jgi:sensor c-di-GMP phosphodiesterase-like protein